MHSSLLQNEIDRDVEPHGLGHAVALARHVAPAAGRCPGRPGPAARSRWTARARPAARCRRRRSARARITLPCSPRRLLMARVDRLRVLQVVGVAGRQLDRGRRRRGGRRRGRRGGARARRSAAAAAAARSRRWARWARASGRARPPAAAPAAAARGFGLTGGGCGRGRLGGGGRRRLDLGRRRLDELAQDLDRHDDLDRAAQQAAFAAPRARRRGTAPRRRR